MNKLLLAVTIGCSTLAMANVEAAQLNSGDILIRAGIVSVQPEVDSGVPTLDGTSLDGTANGIDVGEDGQIGISGTYMFNSQWGVEVLAATPFEHDITIDGGALDGAPVGTTKHLPPTISAQYYFMGHSDSSFQPYVGLGLNYTTFFSQEVDPAFEAALGATGASLDLDDSFGVAVQFGLDYYINDSWFVNASAMLAQIEADATIELEPAGTVAVTADIDPWVYRLNVGYRF